MDSSSLEKLKSFRSSTGHIARFLFGSAVILLVAEIFLLISHDRHSYFTLDWGWGFYATLGFLGSIALLFLSRGVGNLLRREDEFANEPLPEDLDERIR